MKRNYSTSTILVLNIFMTTAIIYPAHYDLGALESWTCAIEQTNPALMLSSGIVSLASDAAANILVELPISMFKPNLRPKTISVIQKLKNLGNNAQTPLPLMISSGTCALAAATAATVFPAHPFYASNPANQAALKEKEQAGTKEATLSVTSSAQKDIAQTKSAATYAIPFDRTNMSKIDAPYNYDFMLDKSWRAEGYWASSPDPKEDEYQGQHPWPIAHDKPWPGQKEFLEQLSMMQKQADDNPVKGFRDCDPKIRQQQCQMLCSTKGSIFLAYMMGPADNRLGKGHMGYDEYWDLTHAIRWPEGLLKYVAMYNVMPSREFYKYVMNYHTRPK